MPSVSEAQVGSVNGQIIKLAAHGFNVEIASLGASLVSLQYQGRDLVRSFDPQFPRPVFSGAILAPWPNRITDGRYTWDGEARQLPITEVDRSHALHGLVVDTEFTVDQHSAEFAEFRTTITPSEGYPHHLQLVIGYGLEADGLRTTATATNLADAPAPFGWGSHAYLVAPGEQVNNWTLSLPAHKIQLTEGERLLPKEVIEVAGTEFDFRTPRELGTTFIDHAYTALEFDGQHLTRAVLTDEHGVGSQIIWDATCPWVQIHTADRNEPELDRTGLAVEPMTCPPGAFNSGEDVIRLEPAAIHQASWLIGPA
ncbi:hypothetical protein AS038_10795 [Arthrobacter sp. NIO-1057]|nr:hypothetical protein AS038_10795 [Arthrobacter sp. NIO-1057]SCC33303.1 aldose 1-epimerase [Arthrobacter sp. NIO-1057]